MRFLLDQDVYAVTIRFLRDFGHDVVPVAQIGCSHINGIRACVQYAINVMAAEDIHIAVAVPA